MSETPPPLGAAGFLRWMWRQFTSMRTALVLLFLLALATIPGSVFPQRGSEPIQVNEWIAKYGTVGAVLDRAGMFDVYGSAWFAAVYLLLFLSLIGCVIPRLQQLWRSYRALPPAAPRNLDRFGGTVSTTIARTPQDAMQVAEDRLRRRRWRLRVGADDDGSWIAAEKGYLKEASNLGFHIALLIVLAAVGIGGLYGWKGNVIVRTGQGFADTVTQYDSWDGGRLVDSHDLPPFSFTLDSFDVQFERSDSQRGAPRAFDAEVSFRPAPGAPVQHQRIEVNEPLRVGDATVYLVGHGYAPHFTITDRTGAVVYDDGAVFLPQDGNFTSTGVVKAPDATPSLGFEGVFLPTLALGADGAASSSFPAPDDPAVVLAAWSGDLGLDSGVPQSVYTLRTDGLTKLGAKGLRPGDSWTLPQGAGNVTFTGYDRWASFQIAHDPGKGWALLGAVIAMLGMFGAVSLQRRRLWVKVRPADGTDSLVQVAGLARHQSLGEMPTGALAHDLRDLIDHLTSTKERM